MKRSKTFVIAGSIFSLLAIACDPGKSNPGSGGSDTTSDTSRSEPSTSDKKDKGSDKDSPSTPGSLAITQVVADDLGTTNANLRVVEDNMAPPTVGALAIGAGQTDGQPLALLSLQSRADEVRTRIKGNIEGTMRAIDWVRGTISMVEPQLRNEAGEKSGKIDMGYMTIEYFIESETNYKILTLGGESGDFHISVNNGVYSLKRRPSASETEHPGINFIEVTFTDEDNWTVRDDNTSDNCQNRPKVISSYVQRTAGVWQGKFMYWGGGNGGACIDAPSTSATDFTYFQFVGTSEATTAAGYEGVPVSLESFDTINNYGFVDETTAAVNPVCIQSETTVTPQGPCASNNIDISTPNFGIADRWILPKDLAKIWNVFPDAI